MTKQDEADQRRQKQYYIRKRHGYLEPMKFVPMLDLHRGVDQNAESNRQHESEEIFVFMRRGYLTESGNES